MILFSSLSVYFDQKFIIVPLLCFLLILKKNLSKKEKIFYTFIYILLSIPMFYLITVWGNFIPKVEQGLEQFKNEAKYRIHLISTGNSLIYALWNIYKNTRLRDVNVYI